jgi:hypothetical protein
MLTQYKTHESITKTNNNNINARIARQEKNNTSIARITTKATQGSEVVSRSRAQTLPNTSTKFVAPNTTTPNATKIKPTNKTPQQMLKETLQNKANSRHSAPQNKTRSKSVTLSHASTSQQGSERGSSVFDRLTNSSTVNSRNSAAAVAVKQNYATKSQNTSNNNNNNRPQGGLSEDEKRYIASLISGTAANAEVKKRFVCDLRAVFLL